jgi:hypothetical protein
MAKYTKRSINNQILNALTEGKNQNDVRDMFIMTQMTNDMTEEKSTYQLPPSVSEINVYMLGNNVIDQADFSIQKINSNVLISAYRLIVKISPICTLYLEKSRLSIKEKSRQIIKVKINDKNIATTYLRNYRIEDIVKWIIRQKENFDTYLNEWETVVKTISKKVKTNNMALLAIKATFSDAMKDYPNIKYMFIEQKRRVRIKVHLPNNKLGLYIDAWWGSYKQRLPEQIEELKLLIEAHSKTQLKDFFVIR